MRPDEKRGGAPPSTHPAVVPDPPSGVLKRAMTPLNLVLLGVGNAVGAGIFVLTGTAAANYAGPATSLSYVLAGLVCLFTSLCYAEAAALIPSAGGSYAYSRLALGRMAAWVVGWCMVFEYLVAGSTVAVGWSAYLQDLLASSGLQLPSSISRAPLQVLDDGQVQLSGGALDLPAVLLTLLCTLALLRGVRESSWANLAMVSVKVGIILLTIGVGIFYVSPDNWTPFVPPRTTDGRFGWGGVLTAASIAFFSYTGFEVMSTAAAEVPNPAQTLPRALMIALGICVALYVGIALVMTGLVHYSALDTASPIAAALRGSQARLGWLVSVVNVGTVVGLGAAVLISIYGQSRVFFAMALNGDMPHVFARVNRRGVPGIGVISTGTAAALIAALVPIRLLGELVSLGCLIAFSAVCLSVLILRRTEPTRPRPFRVPAFPFVPIAGLISCAALAVSLPGTTWLFMAYWLAVGLAVYVLRKFFAAH